MFVLIRDKKDKFSISGTLWHCGTAICATLENAAKVIPAGVYKLENSKSPKFKRILPLIYNDNVKATRGIRIHRGNNWTNSSGCILVGMRRNQDSEWHLVDSAPAETLVTEICNNNKEILVIAENFKD